MTENAHEPAEATPATPSAPPQEPSPAEQTSDGSAESAPALPVALPMSSKAPQSAAELKAQLEKLGIGSPLPALAVGGIAYGAGVIMSIILLVLVAIGAALVGSSAEDRISSTVPVDASGLGMLLRIPFQLTAMGAFGALHVSVSGDLGLSVRLVPVLVTLAMGAAAFFGGRFLVARGGRTTTPHIVVSSLLAGVAVAVPALIITRLTGFPLASRGDALALHAAGISSFFGFLVLVGGGLLLGQMSARPASPRSVLFADLGSGVRLALVHVALFSGSALLIGAIGFLIWALNEGASFAQVLGFIFMVPFFAGPLIAGLTGLGALSSLTGSISLGGILGGQNGEASVSMFAGPWWLWLSLLVLGALVTVATSLLWANGRQMVPNNAIATAVSWAALPVMYFVGGIVLVIVGGVGGGGGLGIASGAGHAGLALWTPFMTMLVGVVVEVLSRFAAPFLLPFVPASALAWFRRPAPFGRVASMATAVTNAHQGPVASDTQVAGLPSFASEAGAPVAPAGAEPVVASTSAPVAAGATAAPLAAPQRAPMDPATKKKVVRVLALVGGAAALLIAAVVTVSILNSTVFSPKNEVEAYLENVESGKFGAAASMAPPNVKNDLKLLLTDAVGAKTSKRLTGHEIGEVSTEKDKATVSVTLDHDGKKTPARYTLSKKGTKFLLFPDWRLDPVEYQKVQIGAPDTVSSITVNGVQVKLPESEPAFAEDGYRMWEVPVLPGAYKAEVKAQGEYFDPAGAEVNVGTERMSEQDATLAVGFELNQKGEDAVTAQAVKEVEKCVSSAKGAQPSECPYLSAYAYEESPGTWSLKTPPTFTMGRDDSGQYRVQGKGGVAEYHYTAPATFGQPAKQMTRTVAVAPTFFATVEPDGTIKLEQSRY